MKTLLVLLIAIILCTNCNDIKKPQKKSIPNKMIFLGYELGKNYSEVLKKTNELEKEKKIDSVSVTNQKIEFNSELRTSTTNELENTKKINIIRIITHFVLICYKHRSIWGTTRQIVDNIKCNNSYTAKTRKAYTTYIIVIK